MLYRQMECFLAVARLGNLSRAAEEMFLTQPTLTARLKGLEEEVGDQLFVRTSRGMRLTDAGREFVPFAERSVESFKDGKRRLAEMRGGSGGRLVLGASPGVGTYALPGLLERFVGAYPNVSVSVRTGHSEEILAMTLAEEVQLGLTRSMRHPEIESLPLYDDELVLVVDPGHRFTARGSAELPELAEEQLIFYDTQSSYYEQTSEMFRNAGLREELRSMEVDNIEAAKRMVEHRLGIAFLPQSAILRSVSAGNLSMIGVEDIPPMSRQMVALKRRDVPASGPVAAFLELADQMAEAETREHLSPALAAEFESLQLIDLFT
ncbi:LysR family transcriptional regulator [Rubrobacter indicoceani]|uniref:LysR family transcriptional regulator n=1 Tax=Rubrobacter indicoceani TaxID=2051957 RepID=UPI000E5BC12C|nr:LysR family transcriptional regulator [Rubrobacter indicoceani]